MPKTYGITYVKDTVLLLFVIELARVLCMCLRSKSTGIKGEVNYLDKAVCAILSFPYYSVTLIMALR